MAPLTGRAAEFLALHRPGEPLLQPNAWDAGSARVLASLAFQAIATTSSGFAATLGRADGAATRDEVLEHCRRLAEAVTIPVAADTENGYADDPAGVAETVSLAAGTGLAGCSIEDFSGGPNGEIYDLELARDRIAAAAEAAHGTGSQLVLTARAENHIRGRQDLPDTIRRLQAYQEAGADVLFAPGVLDVGDIRTIVQSVDRPVNVLPGRGCVPVAALAEAGVARISVGGGFAYAALAALVDAATELRDHGTYGYWEKVAEARPSIVAALAPRQ
jgi:2-methylisocitrate lyase-like PEP mutase family enzyme